MEISNPDKKIFPAVPATKKDIAEYYGFIAPYMLPHIKGRPLTLERFPDGIESVGFIQQNLPDYFPPWIHRIDIERGKKVVKMLECHTKSALLYVANQAGICIHSWLSLEKHLDQPDLMIFDLDPPGQDFSSVVKGALEIRKLADALEAPTYLMTTGSKGVHVLIPIKPQKKFDEVRNLAEIIGYILCSLNPDLFTMEIRKAKRKGKVLIDCFRNSYGQTTIAPYSLRSLKNAPIAIPLHWDELHRKATHAQMCTIKNIRKRVENTEDPWKDKFSHRISLKKFQERLLLRYADQLPISLDDRSVKLI